MKPCLQFDKDFVYFFIPPKISKILSERIALECRFKFYIKNIKQGECPHKKFGHDYKLALLRDKKNAKEYRDYDCFYYLKNSNISN